MNKENIIQELRTQFEPKVESIVKDILDFICKMYSDIYCNIPDSIPEDQKLELIKTLVDNQLDAFTGSLKMVDIDSLAKDLQSKIFDNDNKGAKNE